MVDVNDTIVAIATPPGRGGIGVIRISGPAAKTIATGLITQRLTPRVAHYCTFRDDLERPIDDGIAIFFPGPGSYTGEDILELHGHGGRIVLNLLVERALKLGARLARPGEFTERAFLNDKMDLIQAEAVADLIDSASAHAARSALRSLEGEFSKRIQALVNKLTNLRIFIEGALDFPEEEIDFLSEVDVKSKLIACLAELDEILTRARQGNVLREGINAVIVGRPNVGKSTLLNQLAGREAAIVTAIPGTTRDTIKEEILVDGIPVHIIDTAGLRKTKSEVEREGIRRAKSAANNADVLVMMNEYGKTMGKSELEFLRQIGSGTHIIIVQNKIDLAGARPNLKTGQNQQTEILLSAKTGEGIDLFVQHLKDYLGMNELHEDIFMARTRHIDSLVRTRDLLERCQYNISYQKAAELLADDLRLAQRALGEITGEFTSDDLLGEIFSRFCVGK